jgi:DNA-binding transcriptional regulator/RsmH inhibitor MraZ
MFAPWLAWQPARVPVLVHQVEHASSLAELKRLGQTVYALSWTSQQRSAFWALWRARGQAVREDTDRRIACAQPSRRSARLARSSPASAHAASPSPTPS